MCCFAFGLLLSLLLTPLQIVIASEVLQASAYSHYDPHTATYRTHAPSTGLYLEQML